MTGEANPETKPTEGVTVAEHDALVAKLDEAQSIVRDLVDWANWMGGWESPAWGRAKRFITRSRSRTRPTQK